MAKKKEVKSEPSLYLKYNESRSGGEICEGQENDSWPSHEDENIDFDPEYLVLAAEDNRPDWVEEIKDIDFEPSKYVNKLVYLVIVRYYDGGTFGRTCGYWKIMLCTTKQKEALKLEKSIRDGSYQKGEYLEWNGYFAGLEDVEIHSLEIKEQA